MEAFITMPFYFNLGDFSIIRLATLILSLSISVYLLCIKGKSASTTILAFAYLGAALFNLSMLLEHSNPYYWRPYNLQNVISPFLLDIGVSTAALSFLLFPYYFPHFQLADKRELLIILIFSAIINAGTLGLTFYNFIILEMTRSNFEFEVLFYRILAIAVGTRFSLVVFLLMRKTVRLSSGESRSIWLKFLKPLRRDTRATRALAVVLLLPLVTAVAYLLRYLGILPPIISIHFVWYVLLLFHFISIVTYLNHSEESTSFQVKLVGGALVVMFAIMGIVAIVVGKSYESGYVNVNFISDHTTIHFEPNNNNSYDLAKVQFRFDSDMGSKTGIIYGASKSIKPDFTFPFFDRAYDTIHILSGPMIYLGEDIRENGWGGYHPQPVIAPLIMNLNPSSGGDIFLKSEMERVTITWYKVPEFVGSSPNTVQLVLYKNGSFDINYAELNLDRRNRSIKIDVVTTANITSSVPGNSGNKGISFEPRLIGIHPGGKDAPLQPIRFMKDLPYSSSAPGAIFEAYDIEYDQYLHDRMVLLAVVLLCSSIIIFFFFPILVKKSLIIPLRVLIEGIKKVYEGDFDIKITPLFNDEIGFLTRCFNRMLLSIKSAESNFQTLADNAQDGIFIIPEDGVTIYANKRAREITGFDNSELVETRFNELVQRDEFNKFKEQQRISYEVIQNGKHFESLIKTKNGDKVPVELTVSRTIWHGKHAHVIVVRDITERKRSEEQARQQQQHLMKMDKLTSLGILAAGLAHEINNPNQAIMLNASLLAKASPEILSILRNYNDEKEAFLIAGLDYADFQKSYSGLMAGIEGCSNRIDGIVKNLKAFSLDEPAPLMTSLNINDIVKTAIELLENYLKKATDNFRFKLEEKIPKIMGYAQRLEQVIINLILNACQSLTNKEQEISICSSFDEKNNAVLIIVHDRGIGILKEHLGKIKEPFFTTKRDQGGMGLGLYVSETIVKEHNGTLSFNSNPGEGTAATISLPVAEGS